jgi:acrylyl-CoA reductase (NADPH)
MPSFTAIRVQDVNGVARGKIETISLDPLAPGEVLIRAHFSSINYKDALAITGRSRIMRSLPLTAGIDVLGEVVESTVPNQVRKGEMVLVTGCGLGETHDGGLAEYVKVPATWVVPLPEGLSPRDAMLLGTAGFTAGLCVHRLQQNNQVPEGGPIAVTGASGGVGGFAVDMLAGLGYRVTGITGKHEQHGYIKELGATEVWKLSSIVMSDRPLEKVLWGGAVDNLGSTMLAWLARTVEPWGNICSVGLAMGTELHASVMPFILRGVSILGITSANCPMPLRHEIWARLATDWRPRKLSRALAREVRLVDVPAVCEAMMDGKTSGRYVVRLC